ncbi:MAG: hypothetical protein H7336_15100 [Bacteriovorax sp.]|nr:hypothetical protein [Bacteriovorax sp.]
MDKETDKKIAIGITYFLACCLSVVFLILAILTAVGYIGYSTQDLIVLIALAVAHIFLAIKLRSVLKAN